MPGTPSGAHLDIRECKRCSRQSAPQSPPFLAFFGAVCHIFIVGQEKCIAARYKVRKIGDNCGWRCLLHNGSGGGWKLGRIVRTQGEKPRCLTCLRGCGERCPFSSGSSEIGRGRKRGRGAMGKKRLCQRISSKYSWQLACSVRRKVALSEVHIVSYFYSTTLCNGTLGINFLLDPVSNKKKLLPVGQSCPQHALQYTPRNGQLRTCAPAPPPAASTRSRPAPAT